MGLGSYTAGLKVGIAAVALGFGVLSGSSRCALAQENVLGQKLISELNIQDADLKQAVNLLIQQTGIDVVVEPSDKPYGVVSVRMTDKTVEVVLKAIARSAGAFVRFEDGVYYLSGKDATPIKIAEPLVVAPEPLPTAPLRWEKIRIQNSRPSEILMNLGVNQGHLNALEHELIYNNLLELGAYKNRGSVRNNKMVRLPGSGNISTVGQQVPPVVPTDAVTSGGNNRSEDGQRGGLAGGGGGGFGGGGQGGGLGGGGQQGGFGGGQQGGLGGGGQQGGLGGGGQGQGGGGQGAGIQLLPEGIDAILAYDVDNSLIVRARPEAITELKEIIRLLDIAPKQLMIKAEFIQVQQDDLRSFGIDWQLSRGALTGSTFAGAYAQGDIVLNYATGNAVAALRTSLVEGKGRLVNAPMATTTNNVPVTIQIGTTVPVITSSIAFGTGGAGVTVPQITQLQVASGLTVIPRINGDNSISMVVSPFIQDIVSEVANPSGGTIPIISSQQLTVVRRIGNNETMVIGGLIKKNDRSSVKKIPLFADLPLIGSLFKSTSATVADSELLIFVTPTILPDPISSAPPSSGAVSTLIKP